MKINESQLRKIIQESVKNVLKEQDVEYFDHDHADYEYTSQSKAPQLPHFNSEDIENGVLRLYENLLSRLKAINKHEIGANASHISFVNMLYTIHYAQHLLMAGELPNDPTNEDDYRTSDLIRTLLMELSNVFKKYSEICYSYFNSIMQLKF